MSRQEHQPEKPMMIPWLPGHDPVGQERLTREDALFAMSEEALSHEGNAVSSYFAIRTSRYRNRVVRATAAELADKSQGHLAVINNIEVTAVHEDGRERIEGDKKYSGRKPKRIDVVLVVDGQDGTVGTVALTTPIGFTTPEWVTNGEDAGLIRATDTPMDDVTIEDIAQVATRALFISLDDGDGCNAREEEKFQDDLRKFAAEAVHGKAAAVRQALINKVQRHVLNVLPSDHSAEITIGTDRQIGVEIQQA